MARAPCASNLSASACPTASGSLKSPCAWSWIKPVPSGRAAAHAFIDCGGFDTALDILEAALRHEWHEELVILYGRVRGTNPTRQIEQAEKWLHTLPRDAHLLLTLAELCSAQALWGKAQNYLEASLALEPTAEAHVRMAEIREKAGQMGEACQHYQQALTLCRLEHGGAHKSAGGSSFFAPRL